MEYVAPVDQLRSGSLVKRTDPTPRSTTVTAATRIRFACCWIDPQTERWQHMQATPATAVPFIDAANIAIVAAHPDDETVGASVPLLRMAERCHVLHVTDGAPRNGVDAARQGFDSRATYAAARCAERAAALAVAGVSSHASAQLGVVDQEASREITEIAKQIAHWLVRHAIDCVITHPYEGGHPDHDATAFAAQAAVTLIARDAARPPDRWEMTSYHAGPAGLRVGTFLPGGTRATTCHLSSHERDTKRRMLACFATQARTLAPFGVRDERFRPAPNYRFSEPPHTGRLWYDHFDWGLDSHAWRRLAAEATQQLGLD